MVTRYIKNGVDLTNKSGYHMRINKDSQDICTTPWIYLKGQEDDSSSIRFSLDQDTGFAQVEERVGDIWQHASFVTGSSTLWLGIEVGMAAAGSHIITEDVNGMFKFHAHSDFNSELSTSQCKIINAYDVQTIITQSDDSGEFIGTEFSYIYTPDVHHLMNSIELKTGSIPASDPIRIRVWEGTDDTGTLIYDKYFQTSLFTENSTVELLNSGYLEWKYGQLYYTKWTCSSTFSIKTNAEQTFPWIRNKQIFIRKDDILQTKQWLSGNTIPNGQWLINNGHIYIFNRKNEIQSGVISDHISKYDKLSSDDFSWEQVVEERILEIPQYKQMAVFDTFKLEGELKLDGCLVLRD